MKFVRILFAMLAGVFVAALFIYASQALTQMLLPANMGFDTKMRGIYQYISLREQLYVLIPILLSYVLGALAGGMFAGIISRDGDRSASMLTGFVLLIFGLITLLNFSYPLWFWIASLLLYLPFAWLGSVLAEKVKNV